MIELFEQNIRTNERQSSKGNQLKWENEGIWYKAEKSDNFSCLGCSLACWFMLKPYMIVQRDFSLFTLPFSFFTIGGYKLALLYFEAIFEVKVQVSEGVMRCITTERTCSLSRKGTER